MRVSFSACLMHHVCLTISKQPMQITLDLKDL